MNISSDVIYVKSDQINCRYIKSEYKNLFNVNDVNFNIHDGNINLTNVTINENNGKIKVYTRECVYMINNFDNIYKYCNHLYKGFICDDNNYSYYFGTRSMLSIDNKLVSTIVNQYCQSVSVSNYTKTQQFTVSRQVYDSVKQYIKIVSQYSPNIIRIFDEPFYKLRKITTQDLIYWNIECSMSKKYYPMDLHPSTNCVDAAKIIVHEV